MSVLVKGMKFPENCGECPFDNGIYCMVYPESASMVYDANDSLEWCPLIQVPDHGTIISSSDISIIISSEVIKEAAKNIEEVSDG